MLVCALKPFELFEYSHLRGDNRDENAAEDDECFWVICTWDTWHIDAQQPGKEAEWQKNCGNQREHIGVAIQSLGQDIGHLALHRL